MQFLNYAEFIRSRNSITESKREVSQEKLISDYHDNLFRGVKSTKREAQTAEINKAAKALLPVVSKYGFNEKTTFLLIEFLIDKINDDTDYLRRNNISWKEKGKIAQLFLNTKLQKLIDVTLKKNFAEALMQLMHKKKQDLYTATAEYLKEEPYYAVNNITYEFFKDIRVKFYECFEKMPVLTLVDFHSYKDEFESYLVMKFKKFDESLESIIFEKISDILAKKTKFVHSGGKGFSHEENFTFLTLRSEIYVGKIYDLEENTNLVLDILVKNKIIEIARIAHTSNIIRKVGIID